MKSTPGKILEILLKEQTVSRAELSRLLGISRPAVSGIVEKLTGEKLISETGTGESSGGKPPVLLAINPDAFHVIGIDIGNEKLLRGIRCGADGSRIAEEEILFLNTFEEILEKSALLVKRLQLKSPVEISSVGVSVSGVVDADANEVRISANFPLAGKQFASRLETLCGLPVILGNRSRFSAECELYFGAAVDVKNFIFVTAEKSIGAAIYSDGKLLSGVNGSAGEIRSIPVVVNGRLTPLEKALDEQHILESADWKFDAMEELCHAWEAEDSDALRVYRRILDCVVSGISIPVGIADPELVILGGRFRTFGERFLNDVRLGIETALPSFSKKRRVVYSEFGRSGAVRGAALHAILQHKNLK